MNFERRKNEISESELIQYLFNKYPITAYEMQVKLNKSDKDSVLTMYVLNSIITATQSSKIICYDKLVPLLMGR